MNSHYADMTQLYTKYGMFDEQMTYDKLKFRASLLLEEVNELIEAIEKRDPEEIVDALIDAEVIATGTIALLQVDGKKAWAEVYKANSMKKRGVKKGREGSGGFDLYKNPSWVPPNHSDNYGILPEIIGIG